MKKFFSVAIAIICLLGIFLIYHTESVEKERLEESMNKAGLYKYYSQSPPLTPGFYLPGDSITIPVDLWTFEGAYAINWHHEDCAVKFGGEDLVIQGIFLINSEETLGKKVGYRAEDVGGNLVKRIKPIQYVLDKDYRLYGQKAICRISLNILYPLVNWNEKTFSETNKSLELSFSMNIPTRSEAAVIEEYKDQDNGVTGLLYFILFLGLLIAIAMNATDEKLA